MLDKIVPAKFAEEEIIITFDYTAELGTETLSGAVASAVVEVVHGTDAAPSAMLNGGGTYDTTNKKILVPIAGGVRGVKYRIKQTAVTTNPLLTLTRAALIAVE